MTAGVSVLDEHLQENDDSSECEVQRDDDRRAGGSEVLDVRVPRALGRQSDEAQAEGEPDVGRFLDDPERAEKQDAYRCGGKRASTCSIGCWPRI